MRVLVTGHRGRIGSVVVELLRAHHHEVTGFDLVDGDDVRDLAKLRKRCAYHDAAVHLAAIPNDSAGEATEIMSTNVLGIWHVLTAAQEQGLERIVFMSSAAALRIAEGESAPDYFPIDDDHPVRASRPYGISKRVSEDLCQ